MHWGPTRLLQQAVQQAECSQRKQPPHGIFQAILHLQRTWRATARHRALLQTMALVGLARHSSSGQLNLTERLRPPARGKCQGAAQVCSLGVGRCQLSQDSKHTRPAAPSPCSSQQANAWPRTQMDGSTRAQWAPCGVCALWWAQGGLTRGGMCPRCIWPLVICS